MFKDINYTHSLLNKKHSDRNVVNCAVWNMHSLCNIGTVIKWSMLRALRYRRSAIRLDGSMTGYASLLWLEFALLHVL